VSTCIHQQTEKKKKKERKPKTTKPKAEVRAEMEPQFGFVVVDSEPKVTKGVKPTVQVIDFFVHAELFSSFAVRHFE
jgi:hypothetical protein